MTTDFRALSAELLRELDHASAWDYQQALKDQARAELADEPAVPEGREPASVTTQPSDAELDELAWTWYSKTGSTWYQIEAFRAYARAVLARFGGNYPGSPDSSGNLEAGLTGSAATGEVAELATAEMVRQLRTKAATEKANRCHYSARLLTRAADLLEQRHPAPVPVSVEREDAND